VFQAGYGPDSHTSTFNNTPLPVSNSFWTKVQLSTKSDAFPSTNILLSLIIFSTYCTVYLKLRYRDIVAFRNTKLNGWAFGHWLTANFTYPAVTWKILSDHFQRPCDAINTFQGNVPALLISSFCYVCLYVYSKHFFQGKESFACFRNIVIYLFFDLQVIFCGQMTSIINSICFK